MDFSNVKRRFEEMIKPGGALWDSQTGTVPNFQQLPLIRPETIKMNETIYRLFIKTSDNKFLCREMNKSEFDEFFKNVLISKRVISPIVATLVPARVVDGADTFFKDLFFPTLTNQTKDIRNRWLQWTARIGAALIDLVTLPVRTVTLLPRLVIAMTEREHPLEKYIKDKCSQSTLPLDSHVWCHIDITSRGKGRDYLYDKITKAHLTIPVTMRSTLKYKDASAYSFSKDAKEEWSDLDVHIPTEKEEKKAALRALGFAEDATPTKREIGEHFRTGASKVHADKTGGSDSAMQQLVAHRDYLLEAFGFVTAKDFED